MKILVLNSGSSSIKYKLIDMDTRRPLSSGLVERIGQKEGWRNRTQLNRRRSNRFISFTFWFLENGSKCKQYYQIKKEESMSKFG